MSYRIAVPGARRFADWFSRYGLLVVAALALLSFALSVIDGDLSWWPLLTAFLTLSAYGLGRRNDAKEASRRKHPAPATTRD